MSKKKKFNGIVYHAFDLLKYIWKNRLMLLSVSTLALVLSIIISLNITPKFRSQVVLFPAAPVSVSKDILETPAISVDNGDILAFGEQEETERMLQILNSGKIMDYIVKKYDLLNHYKINTESAYPYTALAGKYKGNVKFRRTEFNSIEISVLDEDPQYAADMANDIAGYIDSTIRQIQHDRAIEAFRIVEKEYLASQSEINALNDSLQKIRNLGVYDYASQAAALSEAYASALAQGNTGTANMISERMRTLSRYGGVYVELSKKLDNELERLSQLKNKYAIYRINVDERVTQVFIVDKANKSERKAFPRRSIIVILSTLSTFMVTLLVLLIADRIREEN